MTRRIIGWVLVYGLVGVLLMVGTTWTLAAATDFDAHGESRMFLGTDLDAITGSLDDLLQPRRPVVMDRDPDAGDVLLLMGHVIECRGARWYEMTLTASPALDDYQLEFAGDLALLRFGWPCAAAEWARVWTPDAHVTFVGGIEVNWETRLPVRPLWRGLIANVVIYAALAFLLMHGVRLVRSRIRIADHRCPSCGYPRGSASRCTECGRHLPDR